MKSLLIVAAVSAMAFVGYSYTATDGASCAVCPLTGEPIGVTSAEEAPSCCAKSEDAILTSTTESSCTKGCCQKGEDAILTSVEGEAPCCQGKEGTCCKGEGATCTKGESCCSKSAEATLTSTAADRCEGCKCDPTICEKKECGSEAACCKAEGCCQDAGCTKGCCKGSDSEEIAAEATTEAAATGAE